MVLKKTEKKPPVIRKATDKVGDLKKKAITELKKTVIKALEGFVKIEHVTVEIPATETNDIVVKVIARGKLK